MERKYKIALIVLVIFSAYAIPVEIDNYLNGSLHQTSIHEIANSTGTDMRICDSPGGTIDLEPDLSPCVIVDKITKLDES